MFGIGLPELILILALALIVVGPDKLPDLARSVAKGVLDLKKTANQLKESLSEQGNPLDDIKPELEDAANAIKDDVMMEVGTEWKDTKTKADQFSDVFDMKPEPTNTETSTETSTETETETEKTEEAEEVKEAETNEQAEQKN